jgi:hypothetical protein
MAEQRKPKLGDPIILRHGLSGKLMPGVVIGIDGAGQVDVGYDHTAGGYGQYRRTYMQAVPYAEQQSRMPDTFFFFDEYDPEQSASPIVSIPPDPNPVPLTQQTIVASSTSLAPGDPARVAEESNPPLIPTADPQHPESNQVSTSEESD